MALRKHTPWKDKRKQRLNYDRKKKTKADAERYRRLKHATIKKANEIFEDGCEVGHERRIYLCIWESGRDDNVHGKYTEYISHEDAFFPPSRGQLASNPTVARTWTPKDFNKDRSVAKQSSTKHKPLFRIPKPPKWHE